MEYDNIGYATDVHRLDNIPTTLRNLPSNLSRRLARKRQHSLVSSDHHHHTNSATTTTTTTTTANHNNHDNDRPGDYDVCCGRGKRHWNHMGNVRFRRIIQDSVERYSDTPTKSGKTAVVNSIVTTIREMGGRFLKEDLKGNWFDIGDQQAREKVGHSLRDQLLTKQQQPTPPTDPTEPPEPQQQQQQRAHGKNSLFLSIPRRNSPKMMKMTPMDEEKSTSTITTLPKESQAETMRIIPQGSSNTVAFASTTTTMTTTTIMETNDDPEDEPMSSLENTAAAKNNNTNDDPDDDDDDEDSCMSDGFHERHSRRSHLSSSVILDKFARRPSFVFAAAESSSSSFSHQQQQKSSIRSSVIQHSLTSSGIRSSGWSFLNDIDFDPNDFWDGED